MGFYKINNFLNKTIKTKKIIINLKKQKKPFLCILNNLLNKLKNKNLVNSKNNLNKQILIKYAIFLPFHLKQSYFKKNNNN